MSDQKIGIEIVTTSTGSGGKQAIADINELKTAIENATLATKESTKAIEEGGKKAIDWHDQAKEAIKSLGQSYPELANAAQLAFNAITSPVSAIVEAVGIIRDKLADGGRDFEKHKGFDPEYINKAAESWHKFAEKIEHIHVKSSALSSQLDGILERHKLIEQLGGKSSQSDEAELREQSAAKLKGSGAARDLARSLRGEAAKIKTTSVERDANTLKKVELDAAKATSANEEVARDLELVDAVELINEHASDDTFLGKMETSFKYAGKFGALADPAKIRATLLQQQASNKQIIDRAGTVKTKVETAVERRAAKKALEDKAAEAEAESTRLGDEARNDKDAADYEKAIRIVGADAGMPSVFTRIPGNDGYVPGRGIITTSQGKHFGVTPNGEGNSVTPQAYKKLREAALMLAEFAAQKELEDHGKDANAAAVAARQQNRHE